MCSWAIFLKKDLKSSLYLLVYAYKILWSDAVVELHNNKIRKKKFNMELNGRKKVVRGDPVFTEFLQVFFRMKNRKMDFDFGPNFSGFFVWLLLTNERASDRNISGAYTRGSKKDLESVFKKIPYEHTSDLHCKLIYVHNTHKCSIECFLICDTEFQPMIGKKVSFGLLSQKRLVWTFLDWRRKIFAK